MALVTSGLMCILGGVRVLGGRRAGRAVSARLGHPCTVSAALEASCPVPTFGIIPSPDRDLPV